MIEGARKAQEQWIVRRFIDELARLKSDDATKQLLVRMKDDGDMRIRLAAATWLLNADHPEALPFIIEEWRRLGRTDHNAVRDGVETTIRLLVASGETAAMNELVKDWDLRAVYERFEIVSVLGELLRPNANDRYDSIQMKPAEPEAKATGIKLLAHALEDIAVRDGMSGTMGNFSYSSPRICDFALWALNQIDAKAYAFSAKASRRQRDKERVTAANVWRREHQLDLLPVPVVNLPKLAESDALKISVVDVQGEGMIKGTALAQEVVALKGTHLAADTIPRLIRWFASNPTEGVRGISIEALREADLTGVEIRVKLDAGTYPTTGDWQIHHGGRFASGQLGNSSGSCSLSYARDPEYLLDFTEDIKAGLQSPAATEFEIRAGITGAR